MVIFAHVLGTDHLWAFVVPAVVAIALLRLGERRARAKRDSHEEKETVDVDRG